MTAGLHRFALVLVAIAVAALVSGALITTTQVVTRQPQSTAPAVLDVGLHRAMAIALIVATLVLAVWTTLSAAAGLQVLAWASVATVVSDAAIAWSPPSPTGGVYHALLAHLFLALIVAIAAGTSAGWNRAPELVEGRHLALLRPLALATPLVVFFQIVLGAIYRHDLSSVMPHMGLAMVVAFVALIVSALILQNYKRPASLRHAATALISLVLTQVCLGVGAFLILILNEAGTVYFVLTTVAHVLVGASTLAASVVLAMQVWRSVPARPASAK